MASLRLRIDLGLITCQVKKIIIMSLKLSYVRYTCACKPMR